MNGAPSAVSGTGLDCVLCERIVKSKYPTILLVWVLTLFLAVFAHAILATAMPGMLCTFGAGRRATMKNVDSLEPVVQHAVADVRCAAGDDVEVFDEVVLISDLTDYFIGVANDFAVGGHVHLADCLPHALATVACDS